jgi:hypothetical protein
VQLYGIVLAKDAIVKEAVAAKFPEMGTAKAVRPVVSEERAFYAGSKAAKDVAITQGIKPGDVHEIKELR